jgi:hypothetical protein
VKITPNGVVVKASRTTIKDSSTVTLSPVTSVGAVERVAVLRWKVLVVLTLMVMFL